MRISISKSDIKGTVQAPPSKSYTIRGLMCAGLAKGHSEIRNPLSSDDTAVACQVLGQIGVRIRPNQNAWQIEGDNFRVPSGDLFCGDSAATLRFMSAIGSLVPGPSRLTAGASLAKRPVKILVEALKQWGVEISCLGELPPVIVNGGGLLGGLTELPGDISSQYVSALLLVAPLAGKKAAIRLTTPLESRPYVFMTLEALSRFGIRTGQPQDYRPCVYPVEGDWSSASYLLGMGAAAGEMRVGNLNLQSLQGDRAIVGLLKEMGASIEEAGDAVTIKTGQLRAVRADVNDCIDLLPTLAVLAALASGNSEFTGIQRARLKESDRIAALREGLGKAGIRVEEKLDLLTVRGGRPTEAVIDSKSDHRIAMAFSLMGVVAGGITIEGAECVSKTYPEYWKTLRNLGVKLDEQ
jgi:3-phosphoshikimate 1-carboxyvinyltransferase